MSHRAVNEPLEKRASMYTLSFWRDALERVVSTAAASLIATIGGTNLFGIDWEQALGITGSIALLTLLKTLAAQPFGSKGTASAI